MNWDAVGAISELVGAIGVVASLVYLGVQIRQNTRHIGTNTRALQTHAYNEALGGLHAFQDMLLQNERLGPVWMKGLHEPKNLNEAERVLFLNLADRFFRVFENLYLTHERGLIEQDLFESSIRVPLKIASQPGLVAHWSETRSQYTPEFQALVDRSAV